MAQGEFVVGMDAVDIALQDEFLLQIAFLERNSWIGVGGTSMQVLSGLAQKMIRSVRLTDVQRILIKENTLHNPTVMFCRSVLQSKEFYCN